MKSQKKAAPPKTRPQNSPKAQKESLVKKTSFARGVYIHPQATVVGDAVFGEDVSIWPGAVIRADMNRITIGRAVNIQDNSTLHVDSKRGIEIGEYTLVGHNTMIHSCTIGRACLIGIGSVILDGAEIGDGAMVTAGCIVRGGKKIPPFSNVFWKGGELVIHENKARTTLTIAGSLEYIELARRIKKGVFGPFTRAQEEEFHKQAEAIRIELFGVPRG